MVDGNEDPGRELTTAALVDRLCGIGFDDLPDRTVTTTKRLLKDGIGVSVAGQNSRKWDVLHDFVRRQYATGSASIYGWPERVSPVAAGFANGMSAHAHEFDDTHDELGIHSAGSVVSTAMAVGQQADVTGAELLRAAALGFETHCRLAFACKLGVADLGWFRSATEGSFAAATVAGLLMDLTPVELEHALAIAYVQAAGNMQTIYGGAPTKQFQPGQAARSGITAALLARDGFTGASDPLFGSYGFFEVYERYFTPATVFDGLGGTFATETYSLKPYPCCRHQHAIIDAGLHLRREGVTLADVESARIKVNGNAHRAICEPPERKYDPQGSFDLLFNGPYALLITLANGKPFIDDFRAGALDNDEVLGALGRVETGISEGFRRATASQVSPATVRCTLSSGEEKRVNVERPKGHPENRLAPKEVDEKFRACLAYGPHEFDRGAVGDLLDLLDSLETLASVERLAEALEPR